jgi:hypothetical protein
MVYNSSYFDSISQLLILSDGKLDPLSSDIFNFAFVLSELKILASQKQLICMSVSIFDGTEGDDAFLHSQEAQSGRYSYKTFISVWTQYIRFIDSL